jgi:hypothetical protein
VACVRWILPPVGELVGVRIEDGVQAERLHGAPWDCRHSRGRSRVLPTVGRITEGGDR